MLLGAESSNATFRFRVENISELREWWRSPELIVSNISWSILVKPITWKDNPSRKSLACAFQVSSIYVLIIYNNILLILYRFQRNNYVKYTIELQVCMDSLICCLLFIRDNLQSCRPGVTKFSTSKFPSILNSCAFAFWFDMIFFGA